ncbi:MAG: aminotransferase class III-fold pyridoxal phosphate-dependent enzyme [Solirubrobacteraceae bacterium]|jgi:ornithine--oxo-acid transaminase
MAAPLPPVDEILAGRSGEALALNDRFLNRQLGRIVRTLGFDRDWVHGDGAYLIDATGERYLDLLCGYGIFAVGRNHPAVIADLEATLSAHTPSLPQLGVTALPGVLAEQLVARAPARIEAMVSANSGTESVEAAIKLARATTDRPRILYAEHAFHGLTLGSLSLNGNEEFRAGFGPLLGDCTAVPFGDLGALRRELAAGDVAAFIVEPVQGKGVNLPPAGFLEGAQAACRAAGTLFVCDEVQTGIGRTGRFFALEHWGLDPDMICVAKALSGGFVPVGGVLISRRVRERVFDGMERGVRHGSTFGGGDLAAAAAIATLRVIDGEGLVERAERLGTLLLELTRPLVDRYDIVKEVRGLGLMWAIELEAPTGGARRAVWNTVERSQPGLAAQLVTVPLFKRHQIFCQVAGHGLNVVKALPALVIDEAEIRRFADALDDVLARASHLPRALAGLTLELALGSVRARVG